MLTGVLIGVTAMLALIAMVAIGKALGYHEDLMNTRERLTDARREHDFAFDRRRELEKEVSDLRKADVSRADKREARKNAKARRKAYDQQVIDRDHEKSLDARRRLAEYQAQADIDVEKELRIAEAKAAINERQNDPYFARPNGAYYPGNGPDGNLSADADLGEPCDCCDGPETLNLGDLSGLASGTRISLDYDDQHKSATVNHDNRREDGGSTYVDFDLPTQSGAVGLRTGNYPCFASNFNVRILQ